MSAKEASVYFIHRRKVIHVRQKNCSFHNLGQTRTAAGQDGRKVPQNLLGLFSNTSGNKLARRRIDRNLTRAEQKITGADRLRIRANRAWRLFGRNNLSH